MIKDNKLKLAVIAAVTAALVALVELPGSVIEPLVVQAVEFLLNLL